MGLSGTPRAPKFTRRPWIRPADYFLRRLHARPANPTRPEPSRTSVAGSGVTTRPTKVASVINVVAPGVMKSSAVSVSSLPGLAVRDNVAINPSGLPVLKRNGAVPAVPVSEKVALNGPAWVISVPIRDQSGASAPGPSLQVRL